MAGAALLDDLQLPRRRLNPADLMGRVAIDTDGRHRASLLDCPAVNAIKIFRHNAGVTYATGGRDLGPINLRFRIGLGLNLMGAMAAGTMGRYQKTAPRQGPAMNRIHVELVGIGYRDTMALGKLGIAVACAASPRQVKGINFRLWMFGRQDIVAPMAITAEGHLTVASRVGLSMNALRVGLKGVCMTGGALYRFQLWRMGNLRGISMTGRAFQTAVD